MFVNIYYKAVSRIQFGKKSFELNLKKKSKHTKQYMYKDKGPNVIITLYNQTKQYSGP